MGFGLIIQNQDENITDYGNLGLHASVFQGELYAVHRAAHILQTQVDNKMSPVHFFIDSQGAIKAIIKPACSSRTVLACRQLLETLADSGREVVLHWVKAHAGHPLNEQADELAKKGTASANVVRVPRTIANIKQIFIDSTPRPGSKGGKKKIHAGKLS